MSRDAITNTSKPTYVMLFDIVAASSMCCIVPFQVPCLQPSEPVQRCYSVTGVLPELHRRFFEPKDQLTRGYCSQ